MQRDDKSSKEKTTVFTSQNMITDEEIQQRFPNLPEEEIPNLKSFIYAQGFGVDTWYDQLQAETFETEFLTMTLEEVRAIVRCSYFNKSTEEFGAPTQEDREILQALAGKIDTHIKQWGEDGAFVKLNTRSPKDAVVDITNNDHVDRLMANLKMELNSNDDQQDRTIPAADEKEKKSGRYTESEILSAFMRVTTRAMRVENGKKVIFDLFLNSRRMYEDLRRILRYAKYEAVPENERSLCEMAIAIRRWDPEVAAAPEREFRGFVYGGALQAVSVYDNLVGYHYVTANHSDIEKRILEFYNTRLNGKLQNHSDSCVIDFFVKDNDVKLIEINPFSKGTGPCLFNWASDREKLMNGPFEFRFLKQSVPDTFEKGLVPFWIKRLKQLNEAENNAEKQQGKTKKSIFSGRFQNLFQKKHIHSQSGKEFEGKRKSNK